jgi:hypothetical protein
VRTDKVQAIRPELYVLQSQRLLSVWVIRTAFANHDRLLFLVVVNYEGPDAIEPVLADSKPKPAPQQRTKASRSRTKAKSAEKELAESSVSEDDGGTEDEYVDEHAMKVDRKGKVCRMKSLSLKLSYLNFFLNNIACGHNRF